MKRSLKEAESLLEQADRRITRLESENRRLKADAIANPLNRTDMALPELTIFVHEYGQLVEACDPQRGRSYEMPPTRSEPDTDGRSTPEGSSTRWLRSEIAGVDRQLTHLTTRIQAALGTPVSERVLIDADGRCVACQRPVRRRNVEVWTAP